MDKNNKIFTTLLEEYKNTKHFAQSRIRQDRTNEDEKSKDYRGRELYELLQNAEDEQSEYVDIIIDTESRLLIVRNGGESCEPFTEAGFCSVMMSGMSPKRASRNKEYIGSKGLGFRSILNWTESVSIVSAGVRCTFSLAIAEKRWEEIKKSLDASLAEQHEAFAKKAFNTDCPLAILAIPEVADETCEGYTAGIEIKYTAAAFKNIKAQIDALSGKVLLFLKNIKRIKINVDGNCTTIIERVRESVDNGIKTVITRDNNHSCGQEWFVYDKEGDIKDNLRYGIGIAYDPNGCEAGEYIYTFFPTQVRMPLPCVVHATFELTSSRNGIIESEANNEIKRRIADVLLEFAERLAELDEKSKNASADALSWKFYDMLALKECQDFADMAERLSTGMKTKKVYPTLSGKYVTLGDSCHYSDAWATFIKEYDFCDRFGKHLSSGFEERGICKQPLDSEFSAEVNRISEEWVNNDVQFDKRCDLISAVVKTELSGGQHPDLRLLVDERGELIGDEAYINSGESIEHLPADINISYVNDDLVLKLGEKLLIDKSDRRELTKDLRPFTNVKDMDINQAKKKIVSYTKERMDSDGFRRLMFAMFNKYSDTGESRVREIASNPDFCLLDRNGGKHAPCELVLDTCGINKDFYSDEFVLYGSVDFWEKEFSGLFSSWECDARKEKKEAIKEFFSTLGVSSVVPMEFRPIDESAYDYIHNYSNSFSVIGNPACYCTKTLGGEYNIYKVPSEKFFESVISRHSLVDLINLIIGAEELRKAVDNCELHYYKYRTVKSETAKMSYAQYLLSKYDCLEGIRSFVVSETLYLGTDDSAEEALKRLISDAPSNAERLIALGAKRDLSMFSAEELYAIMSDLPKKRLKQGQGIQKIYKAIREALLKCRENNKEDFEKAFGDFKKHGKVYARLNGEIVVRSTEEVYYWDNDQLPRHILAQLPKLDIGSRVGEDSVKDVFGVKLAKELDIRLDDGDNIENTKMSDALDKYFKERLRYLLAYRMHNIKEGEKNIKTYANRLKNTSFKVYEKCTVDCQGRSSELQNGDMVSSNDGGYTFHIRTDYMDLERAAVSDPIFCENITEAACIVLQVMGNEMTNCFRNIISHPVSYTKLIAEKDGISEEDLRRAESALGLSEREKRFWEKVFGLVHKTFEAEKISRGDKDKLAYIRDAFPNISLPTPLKDVEDMNYEEVYRLALSLRDIQGLDTALSYRDALKNYYRSRLTENITALVPKYQSWAYEHINDIEGEERPPYKFFNICKAFEEGEWAKETVDEAAILSNKEFAAKLKMLAKEKFHGFDPHNTYDSEIKIGAEYNEILKRYNLTSANIDKKDLSLTYFGEQYMQEFEEIVRRIARNGGGAGEDEDANQAQSPCCIIYGYAKTTVPSRKTVKNSGGRYKSDAEKVRIGEQAEKRVFNAMKADKRFSDVTGCSRTLGGDDSKHYDIQYKKTDEDDFRYLEVKSMGQGFITMSAAEFEFAEEHKERYDFALVRGEQITIVETPFLQRDNRQALRVLPDSYRVPLEIVAE